MDYEAKIKEIVTTSGGTPEAQDATYGMMLSVLQLGYQLGWAACFKQCTKNEHDKLQYIGGKN